jgi:Right handed beta helix region
MQTTRVSALPLVVLAALGSPADAQDWYVDADVPVAGNGKTWKTAFKTLQSALSVAKSGHEIWMTKGNYVGGFTVPDGVDVYGNFVSGDTRLSQRIVLNSTGTTLDGRNASRVLRVGDGCILDSLTIGNGKADAAGGGGALCEGTAATLRYCIFFANNSIGPGSALRVVNNGKGVKADVTVEGGLFFQNGFGSAGGVHAIDVRNSKGTFRNVGSADNSNNGLNFDKGSNVSLVNCYFVRNTGTGLSHIDAASSAVLENCLFFANKTSLMHYRGTELKTVAAVNKLVYAKNNLSGDPKFQVGHYNQLPGSPMIDSGQNLSTLAQVDFSGMSRRLDGDLNGSVVVDIGPREFSPNRIEMTGTPKPGQKITLTLTTRLKAIPTIMGIGLAPAATGIFLDPWGYYFLDASKPVIYTAWGMTGSSTVLTIPSSWTVGMTIALQNLAVGPNGASLSNVFDLRIR